MKIYNKLVRDKIPAIIEKSGKTCKTRPLSEEEFLLYAEHKLSEELAEYQADKSPEELADLLEVVYALGEKLGYPREKLEALRLEKKAARGGFDEGILLEWVED